MPPWPPLEDSGPIAGLGFFGSCRHTSVHPSPQAETLHSSSLWAHLPGQALVLSITPASAPAPAACAQSAVRPAQGARRAVQPQASVCPCGCHRAPSHSARRPAQLRNLLLSHPCAPSYTSCTRPGWLQRCLSEGPFHPPASWHFLTLCPRCPVIVTRPLAQRVAVAASLSCPAPRAGQEFFRLDHMALV